MKVDGMSIPATLELNVVRGRALANVALVIAGSLLIALAAQIAVPIPFTPVPLTLQPLAVLIVGITLGSRRGAAAATLYLLEGIASFPVFSQGHGGPLWLIGPTAGFLYSYPFAAFIAGWFSERGWGNSIPRAFAAMLIALAVIYAGGWSWLAILSGPRAALALGVVPFVIPDLIKIAIGAALLPSAQRLVARLS
jgi:biotin transport system substrate-specific component